MKIISEEQLKEYAAYEGRMNNKELREKLFKEHPFCHWCEVKVVSYPELQNRNLKKKERWPDDMATLEHLYDKLDPENRYKVYKNNENKVLACYKCNFERSKEKLANLPKSYIKKRVELGTIRSKNKDTTPRPLLFNELNNL